MVDTISMATYSRISQMTSTINAFISQASIAKTRIASSMTANVALPSGVGNTINILA